MFVEQGAHESSEMVGWRSIGRSRLGNTSPDAYNLQDAVGPTP